MFDHPILLQKRHFYPKIVFPKNGLTSASLTIITCCCCHTATFYRVSPRILGMRANWYRSTKEKQRLDEAGVTKDVVDQAMQQFIMEIIVRHGTPNKYLCNKDPFTLKSQEYLKELFPNSKFILMIRDGRATSHSIIERKVTISGFDITSYRDVLTKWNRAIESMYNQCLAAPDDCLPVWYEQLVLHPEQNLRKITKFLGIPWSDNMINHEDFVNQMGVSSVEKSTSQIQKPVYLDALIAWWGHIRESVENLVCSRLFILAHLQVI